MQRSTGPIAFVSTREGSHAIYLANEDGSNVTRLAAAAPVAYPAWSPDGQQVAFAYWEGYVMSSGVAIINVDGTLRFRRDEDAGAAT